MSDQVRRFLLTLNVILLGLAADLLEEDGRNDVPQSAMLAITGYLNRRPLERYNHARMKAKREAMDKIMLPKPEHALEAQVRESSQVSDGARNVRPV